MNDNRIIAEAKRYVDSDLTLAEVADEFNSCKRTLQLHFKKLADIDLVLYQLVLNKSKSNVIAARKKGGSVGKRDKTYTKEEAVAIAKTIIDKQLTYREAEFDLGIPSSTLFEMMHSEYIEPALKEQLEMVAEANKKNQSVSEVITGVARK